MNMGNLKGSVRTRQAAVCSPLAGLESSSVGRGQEWARVYAGIQNDKEMQTVQKFGVRC